MNHAQYNSALNAMARVIDDPAASDWLKKALATLCDRDPLDAELDARVLADLMSARTNAILAD